MAWPQSLDHPADTRKFLSVVETVRQSVGKDGLKVAMEPTGTYSSGFPSTRSTLLQKALERVH